jgi:hypothetical protein
MEDGTNAHAWEFHKENFQPRAGGRPVQSIMSAALCTNTLSDLKLQQKLVKRKFVAHCIQGV